MSEVTFFPSFSNDFKYANLLEHKDGQGEDLPDAAIKSINPKIADYCLQLIQLEDLKDEVRTSKTKVLSVAPLTVIPPPSA